MIADVGAPPDARARSDASRETARLCQQHTPEVPAVDQGGGLPSSPGNTRAFTYNGFDEVLTETDSPESATLTYTYDGEGRDKTLAVSGQPTVTYTWNNAHQITNVTNGTLSATIGYDAFGRRASLMLPNGVTETCIYDNNGHGDNRITEIDYYANKNLLGKLTYTYDADGRV